MNPRILFLVSLLLTAICSGADASLVNARRAQALLGSEVWSQILRIENTGRASGYPRALHALVFEIAGILWFYSDTDGTQSFSLHRGRLAEEKANFGPLLRDIDPGFTRWTAVQADLAVTGAVAPEAPLRNGCFIESYAALRVRLARGESISEPRLLSYYRGGTNTNRPQGHTVLAYVVAGQVKVVDPAQPDREREFSPALAADPLLLARAVDGRGIDQARVIPIKPRETVPGRNLLVSNRAGEVELPH